VQRPASIFLVWRESEAQAALLAMVVLWCLPLAAALAGVRYPAEAALLQLFVWAGGGFMLGWLIGLLNSHPVRSLGLVPPGLTALVPVLIWNALGGAPSAILLGFLWGVVCASAARGAWAALSGRVPDWFMGLLGLTALGLFFGALRLAIEADWLAVPEGLFAVLAVVAAVAAVVGWWTLLTPTLELLVEWMIAPFYRVRTAGPGAKQLPRRGPLLIVANHAAWGDPIWLAKVVPRLVRPLMTSRFYDLPVLRWLMVHVVRAIRVPHAAFRREAPELKEAAEALARGECVAIFPEGGMRRQEETLLRPFGQGVWRILCTQPLTPVVVCWIEGGWGSFSSYYRGPPTKNKRMDWRRPITLAFAEPEVLPAELLADKQQTRHHLWRRCLECRRYLGLPVPPASPPQPETREGE
jgi:1-acyl-sn-glycerol-3-phosphate acyltransferase